ncbi:MAG: hypothetical protein NTY02_07530 [Acidobacteria bacterium]|nr:hypothetical protein [Acidobacteriota bacterium]
MRNDKAMLVGIAMLTIAASAGPARAQAQEPPGRKPDTLRLSHPALTASTCPWESAWSSLLGRMSALPSR